LAALASSFFGHPAARAHVILTRVTRRRRSDAGPLLCIAG